MALDPQSWWLPLLAGLLVAAGLGWLFVAWLRWRLKPAQMSQDMFLDSASAGIKLETHRIPTRNGRTLHARWLPQAGPEPIGIALLMHGWGGNGGQLWPAARALHADGWAVLLPDARSHGGSDPDSHSSLPRFVEDIEACCAWLRTGGGCLGTAPLVLLGHSLGAAAALVFASGRSDVSAVVSVSAFAHPEQVMRRWLADYHIPFWPLGWLVNRYIEHVIGHRFEAIAPVNRIGLIQCPVLLLHGDQDGMVPLDCARQLASAARQATLWTWPGTHEKFEDEALLYQNVTTWLRHPRST